MFMHAVRPYESPAPRIILNYNRNSLKISMKDPANLKILLMADYSNFHATLAKGLRRLGHDVTLASDGGTFMNCDRDIDISRRHEGKLGGLRYAGELFATTLRKFRQFDIVSFRDPQFLSLKPQRIRWFLNLILKSNRACFQSFLTTDVKFLDMLEDSESPLRYSEWFIEGKPNRLFLQEEWRWKAWHAKEMTALADLFYSKMKGAVTALYEYHKAAERVYAPGKTAYGGIPIDVDEIQPQVFDNPRKVRLFIARDVRRKLEKGNDLLETAARNVIARHPRRAELVLVENVSRSHYMEAMRSCHVLLDQMYSYTPATMALEGMASGLTAVSGAEPEFYDFIGEKENFPIVNSPIDLEPLERQLEDLVCHPERLAENSVRSREFVVKHNHMDTVARRFLNFWKENA